MCAVRTMAPARIRPSSSVGTVRRGLCRGPGRPVRAARPAMTRSRRPCCPIPPVGGCVWPDSRSYLLLHGPSNVTPMPRSRSGTRRASNGLPLLPTRPDTFGRLPSNARRTIVSVRFLPNSVGKTLNPQPSTLRQEPSGCFSRRFDEHCHILPVLMTGRPQPGRVRTIPSRRSPARIVSDPLVRPVP